MITFDFVPLHTMAHEIEENSERHIREMEDSDDYGCPNIDWDTYIQLSLDGQCKVMTMRDDGKLVGYGAFVIGFNLRYKHILEATSSGFFIEKGYRVKNSVIMVKEADKHLQALGVTETIYVIGNERVGRFLAMNGYKARYKVWSIRYE